MHLRLGQHVIDTGIRLEHDQPQGKWRLRLIDEAHRYTHVPYQVAHALMMPDPTRDERRLQPGLPVMQNGRYVISAVYLGDVTLPSNDAFEADATLVFFQNQSNQDQKSVSDRMQTIETIWSRRKLYPDEISVLIKDHEEAVRAGGPLQSRLRGVIRSLQQQLAAMSSDLEIEYSDGTDPVPALLEVLARAQVLTAPPVPPEEIDRDDVEVLRREVQKWQQWVRRPRGSASVRFRKMVREAYNSRCVMCGAYLPAPGPGQNPGVDAAHILPWSEYDLDETCNGLALCKLHHWAFDEGLLILTHENGEYSVELPESKRQALENTGFSLDVLLPVLGKVPAERLPTSLTDRPHPDLLRRWRETIE